MQARKSIKLFAKLDHTCGACNQSSWHDGFFWFISKGKRRNQTDQLILVYSGGW